MSAYKSSPGEKYPPGGTMSPSIPPAKACASAMGAIFTGGSRPDTVGGQEDPVVMVREEVP